jgi:hypothetical protein
MMSALQNTFIYLQKLAAGMEQVVIDQADHNGKFLLEFDTAQYALKTVSKFKSPATFQVNRKVNKKVNLEY